MDSSPYLHNISVTAIINKEGKYLITKRAPHKKAYPNKWTVPGGKLEVKDYQEIPKTTENAWYGVVAETLKRELREEVNLEIDNVIFLIDMVVIGSDNVPTVVLSYYGDYKSGEVKLDEDSVDFKWVTVEEAEKYDLIDGIYEEIVMVDKIYNGVPPTEVKFEKRNKGKDT
jgi:8-oxo-dGTP diphosphatase